MLTDATYEEALTIITNAVDELGDLDSSVEGYIDLLNYAIEEIQAYLTAVKLDLAEDFE